MSQHQNEQPASGDKRDDAEVRAASGGSTGAEQAAVTEATPASSPENGASGATATDGAAPAAAPDNAGGTADASAPTNAGKDASAQKADDGDTLPPIAPVSPEDEDIPDVPLPQAGRPAQAGRAQKCFDCLSRIAPLALLALLLVQVWPLFWQGGNYCPAELPAASTALALLDSGQWICPTGPEGAQLPFMFWLMWGLYKLVTLVGLSPLVVLPLTAVLGGAVALLGAWGLSRAAGFGRMAAFATGLILLSCLVFPFMAHFMGTQALATGLTLLSLACLCRGFQKESAYLLLPLGFILAALAGLTGGLVYLLLPPLTSLIWLVWRLRFGRAQELDAILGFLIMLLLVAVWLLALILFLDNGSYTRSVFDRILAWPFPLADRWWLPLAVGFLGVCPWLLLVLGVSWPRVLRGLPRAILASRRENSGVSFIWIAILLAALLSLLAPGVSGSGPLLCLLAVLLGRSLERLSSLGSRFFYIIVALLLLHAGLMLSACAFGFSLEWLVALTSLPLTPDQQAQVLSLSGLPVLGVLCIIMAVLLFRFVRRAWPCGALLACVAFACLLAQPAHLLLAPQMAAVQDSKLLSTAALMARYGKTPAPAAPADAATTPAAEDAAPAAPAQDEAAAPAAPDQAQSTAPAPAETPAADAQPTATPTEPAAAPATTATDNAPADAAATADAPAADSATDKAPNSETDTAAQPAPTEQAAPKAGATPDAQPASPEQPAPAI